LYRIALNEKITKYNTSHTSIYNHNNYFTIPNINRIKFDFYECKNRKKIHPSYSDLYIIWVSKNLLSYDITFIEKDLVVFESLEDKERHISLHTYTVYNIQIVDDISD